MRVKNLCTIVALMMMFASATVRAQDEVVYYHTDAIGSVRMVTDANGAVVARYDYLPFGERWETTPPNPSPDVRQFTGKERDAETGLDYFGARYYRPESGRFTSVDPVIPMEDALLDPQRWNRYAYVMNRPLTLTDPDGRCPSCVAMLQRLLQQASGVASRYGTAAYNWATRFFRSQTGQEITQATADTSARVVTVNYAGNGTGQTIDLGVNMLPTALLVMPSTGAAGVEPLIWWEGRQGAGGFSESATTFGRVWPQKGKLQVVHPTAGDSFNATGVNYVAIALFDPSGRYVLPFGVSKPPAEDNFVHQLRYPQTGELAATFTPDFVFGGLSTTEWSADSTFATLYKGPGHAGDSTAKLGRAEAADADRIQALAPGQVQFGTSIGSSWGDTSFWAGRVNDGVAPDRLMAVTSYVGTGTASRTITLDLNGQSPVFARVAPTTAVAKVYRVSGDTTGRQSWSANAVANSITAMGSNQITVGTALNAVGVTYDVWAIRTGLVAPW